MNKIQIRCEHNRFEVTTPSILVIDIPDSVVALRFTGFFAGAEMILTALWSLWMHFFRGIDVSGLDDLFPIRSDQESLARRAGFDLNIA